MNSNTVISMPSQLFTMRSSFKAVANGNVYIGEVDTDPTIPTNQIQVYIEQENGTLVPVAQPIKINSAGLLTASGQVQKFVLTNTEYSMTVQNSYGVDEFYFPRVYDQGISAALEVEERLLGPGAKIYRGSNGKYVQNGDVVPSENPPYTHLAVPINGKTEDVAMSPIASGSVSLMTETSATIGGASVEFIDQRKISSIAELIKIPSIIAVNLGVLSVPSFSDGWSAVSQSPIGGGSFAFSLGVKNDGVMSFSSSDGLGFWSRVGYSEIDASFSGASPYNQPEDNDAAFVNLFSYCSANNVGFTIHGMHEILTGLDTTGVAYIKGFHRDFDGFKLINQAGKTAINLRRPTMIYELKIKGSLDETTFSLNDGSKGLDGSYYLTGAQGLRIEGFGIGHDSYGVDAHFKKVWISACHEAIRLNGISSSEFSTTLSYSEVEIHGNFDGVVGGDVGAFGSSVIALNFHNAIFEKNVNCGIAISTGTYGGKTYNSLEVRQITFTGFAWFENNTEKAFVMDKAKIVSWFCDRRIEAGQTFVDANDSEVAQFTGRGLVAGNSDVNSSYAYKAITNTNDRFINADTPIYSIESRYSGGVAAGVYLIQELDYSSVGRVTGFSVKTKNQGESQATEKLRLNRAGNLTISGTYAPFTGVHVFYSPDIIGIGRVVKGVNFDEICIDGIVCGGICEINNEIDSIKALGVVDDVVELSTGYAILIAAVGDSRTYSCKGLIVNGEFEIGDYLSTDINGGLKAYNGSDMRCVIAQVKGVTSDDLAYAYYK